MRLYFNELMKIISLYITSKLKKQKQTRLQMLLIYFFFILKMITGYWAFIL